MPALADHVALVTGASGAIGRAIAARLGRHGATVVVHYHSDAAGADAALDAVRAGGGDGLALQADLATSAEADRLVEQAVAAYGRVDSLVNNAGIIRDGLAATMTDDDFFAVLDLNLGGVFRCTRAVAKDMVSRHRGHIVNISSTAATTPSPGQANYAASKGAVEAFTRAMAVELGRKGILVNAVAPGIVDGPMSQAVREQMAVGRRPAKPIVQAGDVAAVVADLLAGVRGAITGQVVPVPAEPS